MILSTDIAARHPFVLNCDTDAVYAAFANQIFDLIQNALDFMEEEQHKMNVCVNLALYFEDLQSDTHQFEVFTKLYKQWYGLYVPFHNAEDATSPTAELDALTFVFWLSMVAERDNHMLNPLNDGIRITAKRILDLWNTNKSKIPANEMLADYLFSEETQKNAIEVRDILVWIESRSFLGRWYTNSRLEDDEYEMNDAFDDATAEELQYGTDCISAFAHQTWPLSLSAQQIYAEMIRMEMDDPEDEIATDVEAIQSAPFSVYRVFKVDNLSFQVKDFKGDVFCIPCKSKERLKLARKYSYLVSGLFCYRSQWYLNGMSTWVNSDKEAYRDYCENKKDLYSYHHHYVGQYDEFIERHFGERLYFFKNTREYEQWLEKVLGIPSKGQVPDAIPHNIPFMAFLEPNGQISMTAEARCVKHPDNIYYDKKKARENALAMVCSAQNSTPDLVLHLIEHNLLPDACFSDIKGEEHGRMLFQENIDFLARCTRRDILRTDVYHKRNKGLFSENEIAVATPSNKMTFARFVEAILEEHEIRSSANKEWRVMKCNASVTIIKDVAKKELHTIPTQQLYEAHLALTEKEIQITKVSLFVEKNDAPAASALLYNIVGRGRMMNSLRKAVTRLFR